jgi:hypothetical protein
MLNVHLGTYGRQLKSLWLHAFLCLATSLLVACGGGSTASGVVESSNPGTTTPASPAPLIAPGAYVASLIGKDWVTMLLPTTQASGGITHFYGLYYNATDPELYSGSGTITDANNASLSRVFFYPNISAATRSGSGTISNLGNGILRFNLTFPASGLELGREVSVAASAPSAYQFNSPAKLSQIQGSWQGRWSYGVGSVDNFSLAISAQGTVSTSMTFQQDCQLTQSTLIPNFDGTNLFAFTLTIPNATQCSLKNQVLNGAAFVSTSPVAGKTQRLYIAGVTADGRGISFRADR